MAAYFFTEETSVGNTAYYNSGSGEFYADPGDETFMLPPREDLQYAGPVVVMVGPACASACEFFSYNMTINDRATIIGQYPSDGAGGSVEQFLMPENIYTQMTIGRAMDSQGNIHLEGSGVVPDVKVPVNAETLQREANGDDVILDAAIAYLDDPTAGASLPAASAPPKLTVGAAAESALTSGTKLLEDFAKEKYTADDFSNPGTLVYTMSFAKSTKVIWAYGWCATTTEILNQNFDSMDITFSLDGEAYKVGDFTKFDVESGGQQCRFIYALLSDWTPGQHTLTTTNTYTTAINDGTADYPAGEYNVEYTVNIAE